MSALLCAAVANYELHQCIQREAQQHAEKICVCSDNSRHYGNITPSAQDMAPNSQLKRAADRVARFENQLTERLDEAGQAVLEKLIESQQEIDSITAMENFILGFRLGAKIMMECMDINDGDIKTGGD